MITELNKKKIKIGDRNYTYDKDEDGNEYLSINDNTDNGKIKIIIKGCNQKSRNDVERVVLDVLGEQYIERCLKELM